MKKEREREGEGGGSNSQSGRTQKLVFGKVAFGDGRAKSHF